MRLIMLIVAGVVACAAPPPPAQDGLLNINQATAAQLEALPGIGPKRARTIVASRNARGGKFTTLEEIEAIDGIGTLTLNQIRGRVYLGPPHPPRR